MGKILFAAIMFIGVIISIMGEQYNLAIFFAAILFITLWLKKTERKNNDPRTR